MKLRLAIILSLVATSVIGGLVSNFKSWRDLELQSADIIVAKCTSTKNETDSGRPVVTFGQNTRSDIQVISVLKGSTELGSSRLSSQYQPYVGEHFLIFGNYHRAEKDAGYLAAEKYRVIPINPAFRLSDLAGLPLEAQIQLVLSNRLEDLNEIIKQAQEEKARIEKSTVKPRS